MNNKSLPLGYQIHNYRIEQILGEGGFGITYKAVDLNLNRLVAIKEYMPDGIAVRSLAGDVEPLNAECEKKYQDGLMNYVREAQALAQFEHHNIVKVYTFLRHHKTAYIIMEYVDGMTFSEWLRKHPMPTEAELITLMAPILSGLHELHTVDLLHRDIKPSNIYICLNNRPILLDFGTVGNSMPSEQVKNQAAIQLTEGYAPPEQYGKSGQGPWTDVYAVGACLHLAVTGHMVKNAIERRRQVASGNSDPQSSLKTVALRNNYSDHFLEAIDQAISLEPKDRIESALNLKNHLQNIKSQHVPEWVGILPGSTRSTGSLADNEKGVKTALRETVELAPTADPANDVPTIAHIPVDGVVEPVQRVKDRATESRERPVAYVRPGASGSGKSRKVLGAVIALSVAVGIAGYFLLPGQQSGVDGQQSGVDKVDPDAQLKAQLSTLRDEVALSIYDAGRLGVQGIADVDLSEFGREPIDTQSAKNQYDRLTGIAIQLEAATRSNPRQYTVGSSPEEIEQALQLCKQYSAGCAREWYEDEIEREVILSPFDLGKSEVTVGEFRQYVESQQLATTAEIKGYSFLVDPNKEFAVVRSNDVNWKSGFGDVADSDNQPVVHVSRADAEGYCQASGQRLPTEAEWEYMARGVNRFQYPWGDTWDAARLNWSASEEKMLPVNSFPANEQGFFDFAGSVTEWTASNASEDNTGILKGGSRFDKNVANMRLAVKRLESLDYTGEDVGFRCARSTDEWPG
ncbi:MAG: SUMF1/EgtB/PvdO family nonheme iron enzyme [Granulosicoccus sp.]